MGGRTLWIACLIAAAMLVAAGCQDKKKGPDVEVQDPAVAEVLTPQAAKAMAVTGGVDAWRDTEQIGFECLASYSRADGSSYLTEHTVMIGPAAYSAVIMAREPRSNFVWQLQNGRFTSLSGMSGDDVSGSQISPRDLAEAVLLMTTAPRRMNDAMARFTFRADDVKLEGKYYELYSRTIVVDPEQEEEEAFKPYWRGVTFYQRKDNGLVDTIKLVGGSDNVMLMVRGYDYAPAGRGVLIPRKIEVLRTDARGVLGDRLVQIDAK